LSQTKPKLRVEDEPHRMRRFSPSYVGFRVSGWELVRQFLAESLLLSVAGGALGAVVAVVCLDPFIAMLPNGTPRLDEVSIDLRVLGASVGVSVLTGVLVGILPSITAARTPVSAVLQDSNRTLGGGTRRNRTQSTLLVSEIAITFVLLVGAGLVTRSYVRLASVDHGLEEADVVTMRLHLSGSRYPERFSVEAGFQDLQERFQVIPGVTTVAEATSGPFMVPWNSYATVDTRTGNQEARIHVSEVSSRYFQAIGIPLVAGRVFTFDELSSDAPVAVVSESMARAFWPGEQPIGRRVKIGSAESNAPWLTVVGIVGDVRRRLDSQPFPTVYRKPSLSQRYIILKAAVPPATVIAAARDVVRSFDPNLPISELNTLEQRIDESVADPRLRSLLMSSLAVATLLLAGIGIFGVLAFAVAQRTKEIGIRIALGAAPTAVVGGVVRKGLTLLGIGATIGLGVSLATARTLEGFLFEIEPIDPATLLSVALLLGVATVAASYGPARRAAKVDPVETLRRE